jgi:hypothetical protein
LLRGRLDEPDEYCPVVRGDEQTIAWARAAGRDLPKAGSACTTIVVAGVKGEPTSMGTAPGCGAETSR